MNFKIEKLGLAMLALLTVNTVKASDWKDLLSNNFAYWQVASMVDTIPLMDRDGDFTQDTDNPFDIYPSDIEQDIIYDPESDSYIITEKIGDEYFRMPSSMTFEEYVEYKRKQEEREYFAKLGGFDTNSRGKSGLLDPMSKINIQDKLVDRLFGGSGINIKPQGNIDITLGTAYQFVNNGAFTGRKIDRWQIPFFDQQIKINVDGNIGDKFNLGFNYNTQATFDFDRKIKLAYDSADFSEDDIIKKIEAGDVSLPLRSSLIQGAQTLFGFKTELQFGHLTLTGIISQQRSKPKKLSVQNGATVQEFELRPDQYDENRHFFISHYHRNNYEAALQRMPHILSSFKIANIEVWISDDRPDYEENSTMIVAIADIGETEDTLFSNPTNTYTIPAAMYPTVLLDVKGNRLPDNRGNYLLTGTNQNNGLNADEGTRKTENTAQNLTTVYDLEQTRDFEIFRGRMLTQGEYTFNPELGFISLNIRLQPNQVLGVSYEYFYTQNCEEIYTVGELATDSQISSTDSTGVAQSESVIYTKMLKSSNQQVKHPNWDLMMKNVYALRTSNLTQEDFVFDIFYEDDSTATLKKFIPQAGFEYTPLLNLFNLDRLNSINDPQPDGVFDFVPGVTVIPRNGAIIFPVLEPFGESLSNLQNADGDFVNDFYQFNELYDSTVTIARQTLEKNKFVMKGRYKSSTSSEIQLGSWNIPRGSVRVRAGGRELVEGSDYEVDYGIGRLRILNEAYLQQGVPLDISLEDNSFFSLQQKAMRGLRADYQVSKNLTVGGTYLRLSERPFTQKVNVGDDPINNRIFGLDANYQKEAPWLTKALDFLPLYSTNAESSITLAAEVAALKPGHNRNINLEGENEGVINIDDFEGAVTGFPLGNQPFSWQLASIPYDKNNQQFPEADSVGVVTGYNRAMLNWYTADINARTTADGNNAYTRNVRQPELFPNRDIPQTFQQDLFTFDMIYDPQIRGPYNFDPPGGRPGISAGIESYDSQLGPILAEPETRWAGIMKYLNNNDFQAANYEFIEFWMLNPFMDQIDYDNTSILTPDQLEEGLITFHLGNVSEDILKDNLQFYENGIPVNNNSGTPVKETEFGLVPLNIPTTAAFDITIKDQQDLGLDGLDNAGELAKFQEYLASMNAAFGNNIPLVEQDPSNDDFAYFGSAIYQQEDNLIKKYSKFSLAEGNSPDVQNSGIATQPGINTNVRGKFQPDSEDLNGNNSLDQSENYYKYEVRIVNDNGEIDKTKTPYITDEVIIDRASGDEKWYRFQIPIQNDPEKVGNIDGFRSIQYMRMIMSNFSKRKVFRLAEFELVRSQWRRSETVCSDDTGDAVKFSLDSRSVEENSNKQPFGYELPPTIQREEIYNSVQVTRLDEKALSLNFESMGKCEIAMFKLTELDLRLFKRLQLFTHLEEIIGQDRIQDGDLELFVRIGKDFTRNYYEYTIPLVESQDNVPMDGTGAEIVWRDENMMDVPITDFTNLKIERNKLGIPVDEVYPIDGSPATKKDHRISIKGNPTLGFIKGIQIGVRNTTDGNAVAGEVWVNELRAIGLDEKGGVAGIARMDVQLADLGNLTVSGKYNSIGWGALDQQLADRSQEQRIDYDIAANLELGKFLPSKWNVKVPFYAQYVRSMSNPRFDPFDTDLLLKDKIASAPTQQIKDSLKLQSEDVTTIKTFNFTNVRKDRGAGASTGPPIKPKPNADNPKDEKDKKPKVPMPWDISNFSASYGYTETNKRDPLLEFDNTKEYRGGLQYNYSRKVNYIQPFKGIKSKQLDIIKEFNFNLLPNSFGFNNTLNRRYKNRRFRLPNIPAFEFDEKNFTWERKYDLNWDFTKSLSMKFNASNQSFIDELRQVGIAETAEQRSWEDEKGLDRTDDVNNNPNYVQDYWRNNLNNGGRNRNYNHQLALTYTLPIRYLPLLDWINIKAQYRADYGWIAGALVDIDDVGNQPGATIQNKQNRSINGTFSFDKLYAKSKYIKSLDGSSSSSRTRTTTRGGAKDQEVSPDVATAGEKTREKTKDKARTPGVAEKLLLRPLFSLRNAKFAYREDLSTALPGFLNTPKYFGLSDGFNSPGWDFVAGLQPDLTKGDPNNWLYSNVEWWNRSKVLNQQILQTKKQDIQVDIQLEPWKDFDIDIEMYKRTSSNHSEEFTNKGTNENPEFLQLGLYDVGSVEFSYYTLNTLFGTNSVELFNTMRQNRSIISNNLAVANADPTIEHPIDGADYAFGYGKLNNDVVIPAFIAAYTGQDPNTVNLDIINESQKWNYLPKPNWTIKYNGLSKLPWFKEWVKNITLKHGYKSVFSINRFNSDPQFDILATNGETFSTTKQASQNYYTRWEIPSIQINEAFNPIIGFSLETKKNVNFDFEYKKSRLLELYTTVGELREQLNTEFVFGLGFKFDDVNIGFLTGDKKGSKKRKASTSKPKQSNPFSSADDPNAPPFQHALLFDLSCSFADNITYAHDLKNDVLDPQAVRGTSQFRINPSIEYGINKNLSLRWFAEYGTTTPHVTPPFPVVNFKTAFVVRFKLN